MLEYSRDQDGKEILLKEGKFQVMMEWEKPYMEACIDALRPSGDVLEIGFGCGYSASRIQTYRPKSHTIVECDPVVAARAHEWAAKQTNVRIVQDTWQHALPALGVFDSVFFDDYPLESGARMQEMKMESVRSHTVLEEGKKNMQELEKQLSFLKERKYTDQDLDGLCHVLDASSVSQHLLRFFSDLEKNGQVTRDQIKRVLRKLEKRGLISQERIAEYLETKQSLPKDPFAFELRGERLFEFLQQCLKKHMRKGARFSCFLGDPQSKFEDSNFVNHIINNPFLHYEEKLIAVEVPSHCAYYTSDKALVITITKVE